MDSRAISSSQQLHSPSNHHRKPKPIPPTLLLRPPHLLSTPHSPNQTRISISTKCTKNRIESQSPQSQIERKKDWIHFVGVGGCGLSALAMLALQQGCEVSGSDLAWSEFMDGLHEAGARLYVGHSMSNLQREITTQSGLPDALVVSSAIPSDNAEILHARAHGVPVYKRGDWMKVATEHYNLIAVSGTHGKSTTTSMLSYVLNAMGDDVTAIVGANVPQFPMGNILCGNSRNFVLEADEYDDCFLQLSPEIAVITNVEWEHADIFQDENAVKDSFRRFLKQIKAGGHLILCGDSEGACSLLSSARTGNVPISSEWNSKPLSAGYRITTYGISISNEWHASCISLNSRGGTDYTLYYMGHQIADISLQLAGVHNVLNSLAVIATVHALIGDRWPTENLIGRVRLHLENFVGVSRRFELVGTINRCHILDDYAHHPTEVRVVIETARQKFPQKALLVVFQPHTYSRLATFMKDFATAFGDADRVVVTEVYASREKNRWNVSGRDLALSIIGPPSEYVSSVADVVDNLALEISSNPDQELVVLTLGPGDVTRVGRELLQKLQQIQSFEG